MGTGPDILVSYNRGAIEGLLLELLSKNVWCKSKKLADSFNKEYNSTTVFGKERKVWLLKSLFLYWEWNAIKLNHSLSTIITPRAPIPLPHDPHHQLIQGLGSPIQDCHEDGGDWLSMLYESKAILSRDDKLLADRGQATAIQHGDTPL